MNRNDRAGATFNFYQSLFDGTDVFMSLWQPMIKGFGRAQLEMAQLAAKSGQSTLNWAASLATCRNPVDVFNANVRYFEALAAHQRDSVEKFTAAMAKAAETPPAFEVLKMPVRSSHDVLVLPVEHNDGAGLPRRKVA
jgi:hypothetical protein